jgi:hypothetical protein
LRYKNKLLFIVDGCKIDFLMLLLLMTFSAFIALTVGVLLTMNNVPSDRESHLLSTEASHGHNKVFLEFGSCVLKKSFPTSFRPAYGAVLYS